LLFYFNLYISFKLINQFFIFEYSFLKNVFHISHINVHEKSFLLNFNILLCNNFILCQ
jgi:hypothetical protein